MNGPLPRTLPHTHAHTRALHPQLILLQHQHTSLTPITPALPCACVLGDPFSCLVVSFAVGKGTQHHPDIAFYDPDDPFCVATSPAAKPSPPKLPPVVNYTLPLQV